MWNKIGANFEQIWSDFEMKLKQTRKRSEASLQQFKIIAEQIWSKCETNLSKCPVWLNGWVFVYELIVGLSPVAVI